MGRGRQGPSAPEPRRSPTAAPLHSHCLAAPGDWPLIPSPLPPAHRSVRCGALAQSPALFPGGTSASPEPFSSVTSLPQTQNFLVLQVRSAPPRGVLQARLAPAAPQNRWEAAPFPGTHLCTLPRAERPHPDPCLFGTQKLWQHPHLTPPPAGLAASCLYGLFSLLLTGSW